MKPYEIFIGMMFFILVLIPLAATIDMAKPLLIFMLVFAVFYMIRKKV
jgi:hypothetical protein